MNLNLISRIHNCGRINIVGEVEVRTDLHTTAARTDDMSNLDQLQLCGLHWYVFIGEEERHQTEAIGIVNTL